METKIIAENFKWKGILAAHEAATSKLQFVVYSLTDAGLTVSIESLKDLINNGNELASQVGIIVERDANMFKLPGARSKFVEENTEFLMNIINDAKESLENILKLNSINPLEIDAFTFEETIVSVSETWGKDVRERYVVRDSEARQKALKLIVNVESAINELNAFVKNNPNFGKGITTFYDDRRCLCYLTEEGNLVVCKNELQLID